MSVEHIIMVLFNFRTKHILIHCFSKRLWTKMRVRMLVKQYSYKTVKP